MPVGLGVLALLLRTLVAGIISRIGGAWAVAVLIPVPLRGRGHPLAAVTASGRSTVTYPLPASDIVTGTAWLVPAPGPVRTAVRTLPPAQRSAITFYYLGWMLCAGFVLGAPANIAGIAVRQCGPSVPGHVPCPGRRGAPGRSQ